MAVFHRELVVSRGWVAPEQYGLLYSLARATPGTNLFAFCAGMGWLLARWRGVLVAILTASIPCTVAVVWFTYEYQQWRSNALAMAAIGGTLAAANGMMATSAWQLLAPQIRSGRRARTAVIFLASVIAAQAFSMSPIQVLGLAALAGLIWRVPVES